jgi:type I restriction enzyme S subunit
MKALPLTTLNRAAAIPGLNRADAYSLRLLLPSLDEQRRIAATLDAAESLRSKRENALDRVAVLVRATFGDMFGGLSRSPVFPGALPLQHERGWRWVPISDVARMGTGHTPDRAVAEYWDGEISWINLTEIRRLDGRWCSETDAKITDAGVRNSSAVIHPTGTVCFSRTASIGFVTVMAKPMATSQDFVTWTCGELLNPTFLKHALLMSRSVLRSASSGSTHKTIYVRDAERFSVLLPPRALQDEFASRVEQADALRASMESAQPLLDGLFASTRQRAFAGEL